MTQILIVESDETVRKIIKLNLAKTIKCNAVEMTSSKEAIELLKILPNMDLIICREMLKADTAGKNIATYLLENQFTTPMLLIGNKVTNYTHITTIENSAAWKDVVDLACQILKGEKKSEHSDYVPVSVHYFLSINTIKGFDVYIRVKKSETEFQYVKRLHGGDHFNRDDIAKYFDSGLREFFIPRENVSEFVNSVAAELTSKMADEKTQGINRVALSSDAYKVAIDRIHTLGIDDQTVELVDESIASMTNLLKESNSLAMFLKALKENQSSYAYANSYLCCLILHKIITQFDWQSPQIKEKLVYIAYFHDIGLTNQEYTKINSQRDLNGYRLSDEDKKLVNNHALESSKIVEKIDKIPQGVSAIIKEHHGSKSGIGFVDSFTTSLMPLSMMFIVTESFVEEMLKIPGVPTNEDLKKIFSKLYDKFTNSAYEQTLKALQNMIQNKKK